MKRWLAVLLLAIPGPAHGQLSEGCSLDVGAASWEFMAPERPGIPQPIHTSILIECEAGMDYQVEVANAQAGGTVMLEANGYAVPVRLVQGSHGQIPWGQQAHGEAIEGTGTGEIQVIPVQAHMMSNVMPSPGSYLLTLDLRVVFD